MIILPAYVNMMKSHGFHCSPKKKKPLHSMKIDEIGGAAYDFENGVIKCVTWTYISKNKSKIKLAFFASSYRPEWQ